MGLVQYDGSDSESDSELLASNAPTQQSKSKPLTENRPKAKEQDFKKSSTTSGISSFFDAAAAEPDDILATPDKLPVFESSDSIGRLLSELPRPSSNGIASSMDSLLGDLPSPKNVTSKKRGKPSLLSMLPTVLPEGASSDEEEIGPVKKRTKKVDAANSGSGLIGMLPKPNTTYDLKRNQVLLPESVKKKADAAQKATAKAPVVPEPAPTPKLCGDISDSDEEVAQQPSGSGFFSFVDANDTVPTVDPAVRALREEQEEEDLEYEPGPTWPTVEDLEKPGLPEMQMREEATSSSGIDPVALRQLKGRRPEAAIEIQDVRMDEQLKDVEIQLTKGLTEEKDDVPLDVLMKNAAQLKGDTNALYRQKHQLPWLVQQAKAREIALKNQWADNRMSRNATRAKYGF